MTKLDTVLAMGREQVIPREGEAAYLKEVAEKVLEKVRAAAAQFKEVRGTVLGGSFAKETWISDGPRAYADIDIFVKIAKDVDDKRFESIGLRIGREASRGYKHGKKYAQHPYTEAMVDGVKVNIVPCYDVRPGHWKSAADRSPYHVKFVKKNLDEEKRLQVRMLKRFMKTVGVYGAEIESEGFSGYAAEVLIHNHGTLEGVLRHFAGLEPAGETFFSLKDPIDADRELAKAISRETVTRMVLASRALLEKPLADYFTGIPRNVRKGLTGRLFVIRFDHAPLSEDTLWGELKRTTRQIVRYIEARGFDVFRASAASNNSDKSAIIVFPVVVRLPELEERVGPAVEMAAEVRNFIAKNRRSSELTWAGDDGRVHILQRRAKTELAGLLRGVLRSEIESLGASREMGASIHKNGRVVTGRELRREMSKEGWLREGVDEILADTIGTD